MNTQTVLNIALVLHLIAMSMVIGVVIANYITFKQLWGLYDENSESGLSAFRRISKLQVAGMIGLLLLILSGLTMLYLFHWTLVSLFWFRIKLLIVVLILVNGFTMGRIQTVKFQTFLSEKRESGQLRTDTGKLRRNLQIFNLTQLSLFLLVIVFSVFRFN
jgi:hypothetical protein